MTAFDRAWGILKMPIVPGSLREIEMREEDFPEYATEARSWEALFQDPETDEMHPMSIRSAGYPKSNRDMAWSLTGQIGGDSERHDNLSLIFSDGRKSITRSGWLDYSYPYAGWTETREGFRGRGYASALYDAIAYLMDKHYGTPFVPSPEQSPDAKFLWRGRSEWPVRGDLE